MNYDHLELSHLRMVEQIVQHRGLTAAARNLHISQPALSRRLSRLEDLLGQAVFLRTGRSLVLTACGRALLDAAAGVLGRMQELSTRLEHLQSGQQGQIRLSMECVTCYYWLPAIIRSFQSRHPGVFADIVTLYERSPVEALRAGEIDLSISTGRQVEPGLVRQALFTDEFVAVLPPGHPLARRAWLTPADFSDQHLILYNAKASAVVERFLKPAGVSAARYSSMQFTSGILEMVAADLGIAVLTNWVVRQRSMHELVTIPLGNPGLQRNWQVLTLADFTAPWLDDFVQLLIHQNPVSPSNI